MRTSERSLYAVRAHGELSYGPVLLSDTLADAKLWFLK